MDLDRTLEFIPSNDHPTPEPPHEPPLMLGEDHSGSDDDEIGISYEILEMGDGFPKSIMGTDRNKYHVELDPDSGEYVVFSIDDSEQEIIGHIDTDIKQIIINRH